MKKTLFLLGILVVLFFPRPSHAAFQAFVIDYYVDYNTLIISHGATQFEVDFSFGCNFSSYSSPGKVLLVDTYIYPSIGDDVVYEDITTQTCTVFSSDELNLTPFLIDSVLSSSTIVVNNTSTFYELKTNYECSFSSFDKEKILYVDTFYSPSYGDRIIYDGGILTDTCEASSSNTLNLKAYAINESTGYDKIIVNDSLGTRYLVQFGSGCSSLSYSTGTIYIDQSIFLDGIGDTIYFFDRDQSCRVTDADELTSGSPPIILPPETPPIISLPTPTPTSTPIVLGEETVVPVVTNISSSKGSVKVMIQGGSNKTIRPFGTGYKGKLWAKKIDFGAELGSILLFAPLNEYPRGAVKVFDGNGKLIQTKKPFGGFSTSGFNVDWGFGADKKVFIALGTKKAGTTVRVYEATERGLTVVNSLTVARKAEKGAIVVKFLNIYNDREGIATAVKGKSSTLKVWKFSEEKGKFLWDKSYNLKKIKLSGDNIFIRISR